MREPFNEADIFVEIIAYIERQTKQKKKEKRQKSQAEEIKEYFSDSPIIRSASVN